MVRNQLSLCTTIRTLFIATYVLSSLPNCAEREIAPAKTTDVDSFVAWRGQAEDYARLLKASYPSDSDQYKEAERRYIGAQTRVNTLIDRLLIDLANDVDVSSSQVFADTFEAAISKSAAFARYMEALTRSSTPSVPVAGSFDRQILKDDILRLSQDYKKSPSRRTDLQQAIGRLKWKPFEDL